MRGNPTHVKPASEKGARSKAKKASKSNPFPVDKVVSEEEIRLVIKALLLKKILYAEMKEWGKIAIEFMSNLKMKRQTVMHLIKQVMNDQDGKVQEGMKELETS